MSILCHCMRTQFRGLGSAIFFNEDSASLEGNLATRCWLKIWPDGSVEKFTEMGKLVNDRMQIKSASS